MPTESGVLETLREQLLPLRHQRTIIVGIGNRLQGDDALGPLICDRLKSLKSTQVFIAGTVPENYLGPIIKAHPDALLFIDAVAFGGQPGDIRLFSPHQLQTTGASSHCPSLHLLTDYLRAQIKTHVTILGVQPAQLKLGAGPTPAIRHTILALSQLLMDLFG